jgi:hypothetical protein
LYDSLFINKNGTYVTMLEALIEGGAVSETLAASLGLIGGSAKAEITNVQAADANTVIVFFDSNVEEIAPEDIRIYQTSDFTKQLTFSILSKQSNLMVIKTSEQTPYEHYTIEIYNVKVEGNTLSSTAASSFYGYKPAVVSSDFFRISKVEPASKTSVNIYFTHPLNSSSGTASFYEISDQNNEVFASGLGGTLNASYAVSPDNMVTLNLAGKTFTKGTVYTVRVSGDLASKYTVKLNEGSGDLFKFTGVDTDSTSSGVAFALTSLSTIDSQTLQLTFNKEVHPTRAQQQSSYYITDYNGNYVPIAKAVLTGTGTNKNKVVHISISGYFTAGKTYNILINELNDVTRQYSIIEHSSNFTASSSAVSALKINSVNAIDRGVIRVVFNKALDPIAAKNTSYYTITGTTTTSNLTSTVYSSQPATVYFDEENPNTVLLYLPLTNPLSIGPSYKVTVLSAMKDYLGAPAMTVLESAFAGTSVAASKPAISNATVISSDTIKVTFNKPIAVSKTNITPDNYWLQYDEGGILLTRYAYTVTYINDTILVLKFDKLNMEKSYTLYFNKIEDISGLYTRTSADGGNSCAVAINK